ncbi:MAG: proton-conducting transporter membrane subunit [Byssovorax sp.]
MTGALLIVPVVLPLLTAVLLGMLTDRPRAQLGASLGSGAALLTAAALLAIRTTQGEILVTRLGGWAPQVGIVWVADGLAALMLVFAAVVSLSSTLYGAGSLRKSRELRYYHPLQQLLLMGVNGSLITGDFFNLFVFFEIMLLASFALITLGGRAEQLRRGFPYVVINLVSSAVFLVALGVIYGAAGSVNMAELAVRVRGGHSVSPVFWAGAALMLVVFVVKSALVPVFMWLPDSYPAAPAAINGLFAGLLTKVGVYTLFRTVPLLGGPAPGYLRTALLALAAATMLLGVVGALGRSTLRGILSFHIVSQVGYMIFGLALLTQLSVAAGLFHTVHNMIAKTALLFAVGIAERVGGSGTLGDVRGLARTHRWLAVGFFLSAMSLAGLPPLSGFWGKLLLVIAGVRAGAFTTVAIALVVGLFTLASMLKIWNATFWGKPAPASAASAPSDRSSLTATLALSGLTVVMGLLAAPIVTSFERAAAQLLAVTPYVEAVLGAPTMISVERR